MNTKQQRRIRLSAALMAIMGLVLPLQQFVAVAQVFDPSTGQVKGTDPSKTSNACTADPTVCAQINAQIAENQQKLDSLKQQQDQYQQQIDQTQGQISSLNAEISVIDNQLAITQLQIQQQQTQIDSLQLEIRSLQLSIDQKNADIDDRKKLLTGTIQQLDASSRVSPLALVLQYNNFGEFFSQAQAQAQISSSLNATISSIQRDKAELVAKQSDLSATQDSEKQAKLQLQDQQQASQEQQNYKTYLLSQSKKTAAQYQQMLDSSVSEADAVNSAINSLQAALQSKLSGGTNPAADLPSPSGFIWPVPGRTINAYFMDPNYSLGGRTHWGIDIQAQQGTPVKVTADGVVTGVRPADLSGAPSVVQIQHGGGFVTYYLHMHQIFVATGQEVKQGDIIGMSGGQCGTAGAGTCGLYTTGAHLHYEMHNCAVSKYSNCAINPLSYLP